MTIRKFEEFTPKLDGTVFVDDSAVVIGNVEIGSDSSIWPMCSVRGDIHSIRIGERTNIQDGSILHVTHDGEFSPGGNKLTIGSDVTVGHNAIVHACTVEDSCLIGMGRWIRSNRCSRCRRRCLRTCSARGRVGSPK